MEFAYYCGIDGKRMQLSEGKYTLYWRCPKYEEQNRDPGEKSCQNRLSWKEASQIDKLNIETGKRYRVGTLDILGGPVEEGIMKVFVINRRTCKK